MNWLVKAASWDESKHKRGKPENAGEFTSTGAASKPADARHNDLLDDAMNAPASKPASKPAPLRSNDLLDEAIGEGKPPANPRLQRAMKRVEAIKAEIAAKEAAYLAEVERLKHDAAEAMAGAKRPDAFEDYQPGSQDLKQHPAHGPKPATPPRRAGGISVDSTDAALRDHAAQRAAGERPGAMTATPPPLPQRQPKAGPPALPTRPRAQPPALPHHRSQQAAESAANGFARLARSGGDPAQLQAAHGQAKQAIGEHLKAGLAALQRMGDRGNGAARFKAKIQAAMAKLDALAKGGSRQSPPLPSGNRSDPSPHGRAYGWDGRPSAASLARKPLRKGCNWMGMVTKGRSPSFPAHALAVPIIDRNWLGLVVKSKDDSGHEHKGKGPGGGQFTAGSGGGAGAKDKPRTGKGNNAATTNETGDKYEEQARKIVGGKLKSVKVRAWTGEPQGEPISKDLAGAIGEEVLIQYLKSIGYDDAGKTSALVGTAMNNLPFDLIHDHQLIEAKGGQTGKPSGLWQLKYDGRFTKEQEARFARMKSPEAVAAAKKKINQAKVKGIHDRKAAFVQQLSKKLGFKIKPGMMTVIINHETKTADIYKFDGLHDRIPWGSEMAQQGYVTSVRYG